MPPVFTEPGSGVADDLFDQARAFDQRGEVDAGLDPHLVAQKHAVLGAHVAGGTAMARGPLTAQWHTIFGSR
jgi:hypothetical protein